MLSCHRWSRAGSLLFPIILGCGGSPPDFQSPNPPAHPADAPLADLIAGAIEAPIAVRLDSLLKMKVVVRNQGPRTAGTGWFIRVFLSPDPAIEPGDILIDQFVATRELPPGAEDRYLQVMKLPARLTPRAYYLGSMLDVTRIVPETDEDNNTLRRPMTIRITPRSSGSNDK